MGWGFLYECLLHYPAQLGGSLVTICLLRFHSADVVSALLLQALLCSCGLCRRLRPAATSSALQQSLSVMAGCLGNGRLGSNGSVPQKGRIASVMVNAPPPPSCTILGSAVPTVKLSTWRVSNCHFVCPCGGETHRARSPGSLPQSTFLFVVVVEWMALSQVFWSPTVRALGSV